MDFGRPLIEEEGVTTRSNIRILPSPQSESPSLDDRLILASNRAALDLFQTTAPRLANAALYPERLLPQSGTIQPNDLVVVFESFDNLNFVYATPDLVFSNRNGVFTNFIGKKFGCKIRSTSHSGYGFCYLLKPTPELWVRSLPHRTQVIHELDASMIIYQLWLQPNMVCVESGTGSGGFSHAVVRTLAPHGHLHTFEFHAERAETARREFQSHNLSHLVTVRHADVCEHGFAPLLQRTAHAVVLDLPEPWLAVPHAAFVLKRGGRIACYSPCVEQSQRTIEILQKHGFHSISTMEYRLREYNVDVTRWEAPPCTKRTKHGSKTRWWWCRRTFHQRKGRDGGTRRNDQQKPKD